MNPETIKANEEANRGIIEETQGDLEKQLEKEPDNEMLKDMIEYTKTHLEQLLEKLNSYTQPYEKVSEKDIGSKTLGASGVSEPDIHKPTGAQSRGEVYVDSQGFVHSTREGAINADRTGNNQDPVETKVG